MFRGRRRFVALVTSNGLWLESMRNNKIACYSVGSPEKRRLAVLKKATPASTKRARRLIESAAQNAWTKVVWDGDTPTYIYDPSKFPAPGKAR